MKGKDRAALEDTLFLALQRPAMFLGVPAEGLLWNVTGSILASAWIARGGLSLFAWVIILPVLVHLVMKFLVSRDYNMFAILRVYIETKGQARHKDLWGGSSIAPLPARKATKAGNFDVSL